MNCYDAYGRSHRKGAKIDVALDRLEAMRRLPADRRPVKPVAGAEVRTVAEPAAAESAQEGADVADMLARLDGHEQTIKSQADAIAEKDAEIERLTAALGKGGKKTAGKKKAAVPEGGGEGEADQVELPAKDTPLADWTDAQVITALESDEYADLHDALNAEMEKRQ